MTDGQEFRADPDAPGFDLESFRADGHNLIDWIADYLEGLERRPIHSTAKPGDVRALLPDSPPEHAEDMAAILGDLDDVVVGGITHWQHPGWFAYFPASSSPASILGELAAAGLGVQGMLWSTSPAVTEIESTVMDWLVELLDLPVSWRVDTGPGGGVLQVSASDSTHTALVVARHRLSARGDISMDDVVAYGSAQAHSSIEKGARVAGYRHYRAVDVDADHSLDPIALERAIHDDRNRGLTPAFVCSTVGTTGTAAVDPVRRIAEVVAAGSGANRPWHHVDAAYAGSAMVCPEMRHFQDGLELVDSYTFNPHKWMLTNFDCSAFWVADRSELIHTMNIEAPYLANTATEQGDVIDYRDWHVPLGRRFRALKLWFVLRSYGASGIRGHIRQHLAWAAELGRRAEAHPHLELAAPVMFGLVSLRHTGGDAETDRLAHEINDSGWASVTASTVDARRFLRVSIGSTWTQARHVERLWQLLDDLA